MKSPFKRAVAEKPAAPTAPPAQKASVRVKITNKDGAIAQPYENELAPWLAKGWTRAT